MVVRGLVRRVVRGVVRRVVRGVGSVGSPRSGGQFFQLSPCTLMLLLFLHCKLSGYHILKGLKTAMLAPAVKEITT